MEPAEVRSNGRRGLVNSSRGNHDVVGVVRRMQSPEKNLNTLSAKLCSSSSTDSGMSSRPSKILRLIYG